MTIMSLFSSLGTISPPAGTILEKNVVEGGLVNFLNTITNLIITVAGLFTLVNFILAGYGYMTAADDSQKIAQAGSKMLQSAIGLGIVAASLIIAGLLGQLLFGDATALIAPKLFFIK
jgi:hypothetical protein